VSKNRLSAPSASSQFGRSIISSETSDAVVFDHGSLKSPALLVRLDHVARFIVNANDGLM
jgi:hypothetical protein